MTNLLNQNFDATAVKPIASYDVLPEGRYLVHIVASEMQVTRSGTGEYLYLKFEVLEGAHAGRLLIDRLNLNNPSPRAVDIATRTLGSICRAVRILSISEFNQLHLIPLIAEVRVHPPKKDYGPTNKMLYFPCDGQAIASLAVDAGEVAPAASTDGTPTPQGVNPVPWTRAG